MKTENYQQQREDRRREDQLNGEIYASVQLARMGREKSSIKTDLSEDKSND